MVRLRSALPALVVWALSAALYGAYFQAQWAFGARPMARLIEDTLKKALAEELLFGRLQKGGRVRVDLHEGKPGITVL
jgi:ATP-dependent Clp protease ATP-binding subunit ClpA